MKKSKRVGNERCLKYELSKGLRPVLPGYLVSVLFPMLSGVIEKLMEIGGQQGRADNSPHERALTVLRENQQHLHDHIHNMSSEEQLYYAYMIHSLSMSLVEYQGSLEQLESSFEVHALVTLLLTIGHSPDEDLCKWLFGDDIFSFVAPAFTFFVLENGVSIIQNPTIMLAFEEIDINYDTIRLVLNDKTKMGESTMVSCASDPPTFNEKEDEVDKLQGSVVDCYEHPSTSLETKLLEGEKKHSQSTSPTKTSHQLPLVIRSTIFGAGKDESRTTLLKQLAFPSQSVLEKVGGKLLEGRDTSEKTEFLEDVGAIGLLVSTSTGPNIFESSGSEHTTIDTWNELTTSYVVNRITERRRAWSGGMKSDHDINAINALLAGDLCFEPSSSKLSKLTDTGYKQGRKYVVNLVEHHGRMHSITADRTGSDDGNLDNEVVDFVHLLTRRLAQRHTHLGWSNKLRTVLVKHETHPPAPPPTPSNLWCWGRLLKSVPDVYHYIKNKSHLALEELDTECQETICHAIASVFRSNVAVRLIRMLRKKVSPSLFGTQDKHGNTPLHNAVMSGDVLVVEELVDLYPSAIFTQNVELATPLHIAVMRKNKEIMNYLVHRFVTRGATPKSPSSSDLTEEETKNKNPVHIALHDEESQTNSALHDEESQTNSALHDEESQTNSALCDEECQNNSCDPSTPTTTPEETENTSDNKEERVGGTDVEKRTEIDVEPLSDGESECKPEISCRQDSTIDLLHTTTGTNGNDSDDARENLESKLLAETEIEHCLNYDAELLLSLPSTIADCTISPEQEPGNGKHPAEDTKPLAAEAAGVHLKLLAMIEEMKRPINNLHVESRALQEKLNEYSSSDDEPQQHPQSQPTSLSSCECVNPTAPLLPDAFPDCTLATESSEREGIEKPLRYQQSFTDSVTSPNRSPSPKRHPVSRRIKRLRKRAKARIYQHRVSTSLGSDSRDHCKRRPPRPQETVSRALESPSYSDCDVSSEEHSTNSTAGDSPTGDTTLEKRQHTYPLSPLHHKWTKFKLQSRKLTKKEKQIARVVLGVVRSKKKSIPLSVLDNLHSLRRLLNLRHLQNQHQVQHAPYRGKRRVTKGGASASPGKPSTLRALTQLQEKEKQDVNDIEVDGSPVSTQTHSPSFDGSTKLCTSGATNKLSSSTTHNSLCREEESSGVSVLEFSNSCNPLDVIHSHMKVYSKCCPRHDIRNIVTVGITCPPSDAFGPKRRYSSIKDLHSDPTHSQFDFTRKLSAQSSSNRHYRDSESQQIMFERPAPKSRQNRGALPPTLLPQSSLAVVETSESHPSLPLSSKHQISQLHPSTQSLAQQPSKMSEATAVTATHRETSADTRQENPETAHSSIPSRHNTSLLHSHTVPQDHKERLRSTAERLHAQDYNRILILAYEGEPPDSLPPQLKIPYIFITGLAYYKLSNHKKSVQYFTQCLRLADECRRDGDITICNIYIGDIEFAKRRYPEAAGRYKVALHHYSRDSVAQDFRMVMPTRSAVWLKCGSAFKNASRVGDSVAAYKKAIELANSKNDQLSGHTSLGNLYQGIGENGRAVKEYEAAIELAQELDDNISLGWNHGNLGNSLLGLHQRDKALHHLFKALDMAVDYETTPQAIGRAYNNLGTAFQSLNELSKAEEHYDLALSQAICGNDIPGQARVYGNIGNLQMLNKQYDRAVPHYTEVMRLSQDKATITTAHHNRGCAYYDWAEKKKTSPSKATCHESVQTGSPSQQPTGSDSSQNSSSDEAQTTQGHFRVSLHGPDFEKCQDIFRPHTVPQAVQKYYLQGTRDLEYVIKHHEENFNGIKGSAKGLSLSVSLFETNSRTFHRMQDCLVHIQEEGKESTRFEEALQVAEKSRARTLGELMLKRRGPQLEHELQSLPSLDQMKSIVGRQLCPVVYLSYTGERLLGWLLYPTPSSPEPASVNMFEVPLSDNEFDGKSLDYHLRYSLNEQLVENSFEMYKPFDHEKEKTEPLEKLYDLVAQPVMMMLSTLDNKADKEGTKNQQKKESEVRKIVVIPDSYTNLLPFTCVLNKDTGKFWGDNYYFQIMPSLLTMGILDQLPTVSVTIPVQYQQMLCVVGNPSIPRFQFNNEDWDLGKLPHATKEAEWVSHILQCNPILHERATKDAVLMRIMNAKVIHLATHSSAVAGFLAFAGMTSSSGEAVEARKVLIYPDEIESLNISPALVVLSSCDSGRGVFKADGIQGMARAFILAGAQAVLTALWRVPDESACIFMQFFYQYLVEGMKGTEALHKAILCLRCFSKYSQYIHWSGYQLTGREFQFSVSQSSSHAELATRLGTSSVFPRLDILKQLETAFLNNPRLPTDVQVCTYLIY